MQVAKEYGQSPMDVAAWPQEWIAAAVTVMDAEHGAEHERQVREQRQARMRGAGGRR
jgi:hypothetical protein